MTKTINIASLAPPDRFHAETKIPQPSGNSGELPILKLKGVWEHFSSQDPVVCGFIGGCFALALILTLGVISEHYAH